MPQGELVNDHQRDRFRSGQKAPQRIRVAPERIRGAFAMREAAVRGVQVLPGPVGLDWRAIEVPGLEFIEAGFDQNRYLPTVQSDVDRLPGAQKARADGQVHRHVGELRAEDTRLYSPSASPRDWARRVAAEHVCSVRCRLGMAGEDKQAEYLAGILVSAHSAAIMRS